MLARLARRLIVLACLGAWLWPRAGSAHAVGKSSLQLELAGGVLEGSWRVGAADLDPVLGLDENGDRRVDAGELERGSPAVSAYLASRLEVAAASSPCATRVSDPQLEGPDLVVRVEARCEALGEHDDVNLRYDLFFEHDSAHQALLRVRRGDVTHSAAFTHRTRNQTIAARAPGVGQSLSSHLISGVWHIALGYDHLAFLLTLLLPAVLVRRASVAKVALWRANGAWEPSPSARTAWLRVLRIVTAFTLAHSITLSLAALGVVRLPERPIEIIIALSVVVAALANLFTISGERSYWLALPFGLVHGFGFANALGELGLPKGRELVALLGFNLGVELGQLAVVAVLLPLALASRRSRVYVPWVLRGGSAAIAALALFWVVERGRLEADAIASVEPRGDGGGGSHPPLPPELARLAERWSTPPASNGYQPFFRPRIAQQILVPGLAVAVAAVRDRQPAAARSAATPAPYSALPSPDAARAALDHGDPSLAIGWLATVAEAQRSSGDRVGAAQAHAARGMLLALNRPEAAVEALALARGFDPGDAAPALWLATIEARLGRVERAEATLRALLYPAQGTEPVAATAEAGKVADPTRADAWSLLGDLLMYRKRWPEAERALEVSMNAHVARGDRASAADDQRRLADVTLALARPREALAHFERAIELSRSSSGESVPDGALASDHRNAAAVAQLIDDLPVAARLYRRALELDESRGERERAREDLVRLAQVYRQLDQLDEARACLERALAINAAAGWQQRRAEDLAQLGHLHQLSDQLELAEGFYERALAIPELPAAVRADVYANLGNVHRRQGAHDRASAMYRRALADYRDARETSKADRVEQYLASFRGVREAASGASVDRGLETPETSARMPRQR